MEENLTKNNHKKMTNFPLVTIGVPFYNAEAFLEFTILSILSQTYKNWALILINDGSNDSSLDIAYKYKEKDHRISVLSDGLNKGLACRLNELTALVQSKYYARMDADDIMVYNRIETQLEYLEAHPEVDVVGGGYYSIDQNNNIKGIRLPTSTITNKSDIFKHGLFVHPTIMGKSEWFKNNLYEEQAIRMEDIELWLRTIDKSKFHNLSAPLLFYREFGIPTLKKYTMTNIGIIKMLQKRKKYNITFINAKKKQLLYLLKIIIWWCCSLSKLSGLLISRRIIKMTTFEETKANNILRISISQK